MIALSYSAQERDWVMVEGIWLRMSLLVTPHAKRRLLERYEIELGDEAWAQIAVSASRGEYQEVPNYAVQPFRIALHVPCGDPRPGAAVKALPVVWREPKRGMPFGAVVTVLPTCHSVGW